MMRNLPRLLKTSIQRISRNPYNALAAILVMFLAFFTTGAFILIGVASGRLLSYFESLPQVRAFLQDDTSADQVKKIQQTLIDSQVVSDVKYISKEEAVKIFKEWFKNDPLLTFGVTADTLPASIEVSTYNLDDLSKVAAILEKEPAVEEVTYKKDIADTLRSWVSIVRIAGGGATVFLVLTSFLITMIVIGLNISLHKDEIEIMKLVGATSGYVRTPFIFEGIFYGASSALVSTIVLFIMYSWLSPTISKAFDGISILSNTGLIFSYLLIGEVVVGALIGTVGALVATRRYLNV